MKQDEPGFTLDVPGLGEFEPHGGGMTAPGTSGFAADPPMYQESGAELGTVPVSHIYDSNAGNVPMVTVHTSATNSAENPLRDPVSATVTPTSNAGTVHGAGNPNAGH